MIIGNETTLRTPSGISDNDLERIMDFLQGAVYCWCKNRRDEWFSIRDLMGGENFNWNGTPLQVLYDKHIANGWDDEGANKEAGKDAGWILKRVISRGDEPRSYETKKEALVRHYRWVV